ncbi:MAG: EVE domain-containing protein [Patescibacteria group bacterium]
MSTTKNYWLIKSEATCYSIDDLARDKVAPWTGIRNFQARNYIRDGMRPGDRALFYHSSGTPTAPSGVYGIAEVVSEPYLDPTALDVRDEHYDPKGADWVAVDMKFVSKLDRPVTLADIKKDPLLRKMLVAKQGQRLSVMPVTKEEFEGVVGRWEK